MKTHQLINSQNRVLRRLAISPLLLIVLGGQLAWGLSDEEKFAKLLVSLHDRRPVDKIVFSYQDRAAMIVKFQLPGGEPQTMDLSKTPMSYYIARWQTNAFYLRELLASGETVQRNTVSSWKGATGRYEDGVWDMSTLGQVARFEWNDGDLISQFQGRARMQVLESVQNYGMTEFDVSTLSFDGGEFRARGENGAWTGRLVADAAEDEIKLLYHFGEKEAPGKVIFHLDIQGNGGLDTPPIKGRKRWIDRKSGNEIRSLVYRIDQLSRTNVPMHKGFFEPAEALFPTNLHNRIEHVFTNGTMIVTLNGQQVSTNRSKLGEKDSESGSLVIVRIALVVALLLPVLALLVLKGRKSS